MSEPSPRRLVKQAGRKVREHLATALDALDYLVEDAGPEAITLAERAALRESRESVLRAIVRLNDAPEITALSMPPREVTG